METICQDVSSAPLTLAVVNKELLAADTHLFTLQHPQGQSLPPVTAGAHLTVVLPNAVRRNYSLCSDPADRTQYQIAVKRISNGRGGSISMADEVHAGQILQTTQPRNNFELVAKAQEFVFVAGGIGITPILSMMRHLCTQPGKRFKLIYCTRDAASTAFADVLAHPEFAPYVQIHHDHGNPDQSFDFWPLLETPSQAHVYCCGPKGLMDAVADMSGHWPTEQIHFESFGVEQSAYAANAAFTVRLNKSGRTLQVPTDKSILETLRLNGVVVLSSCESGTCGSCRTALLAGDVEHRDMVLSDEEKATQIMVCVSRARTSELVLDL
jgi:phthalate 4,5-dioxygenase reductase component